MIPKIKLPYYPIKVPDNGREIHIKPYTIEIEKYLVQLDNKDDINTQLNAIAEILKYCIVEEDFDVEDLYIGTLYWLYLKCYEISVKDTVEFVYKHKCNNNIDINIPIKDIKYNCDKEPLIIDIDTEDGKYFVEFYPLKLKGMRLINEESDVESSINLISSCLERMYDESGNNEIQLTYDDKKEIISYLSLGQIEKISNKVQNISKPIYIFEGNCPYCGEYIKEKLEDFFI